MDNLIITDLYGSG